MFGPGLILAKVLFLCNHTAKTLALHCMFVLQFMPSASNQWRLFIYCRASLATCLRTSKRCVLFDAVCVVCLLTYFQTRSPISAGEIYGMRTARRRAELGAQVWNSTTIMALSARLPWLTALVLPQRHLETPQRKRLSHSEPPRREQPINSVYSSTQFVAVPRGFCAVMGILNRWTHTHTQTHTFDSTLSSLLSLCLSRCVLERGSWDAGDCRNAVISETALIWHT